MNRSRRSATADSRKARAVRAAVENELEALSLPASGKLSRRVSGQLLRAADRKQLRRLGLMAGGALGVLALAGSFYRYETFKLAMARELKKQLAPVKAQLSELEKQNEALRQELARR